MDIPNATPEGNESNPTPMDDVKTSLKILDQKVINLTEEKKSQKDIWKEILMVAGSALLGGVSTFAGMWITGYSDLKIEVEKLKGIETGAGLSSRIALASQNIDLVVSDTGRALERINSQ
ncbi:hypothetical protein [Gimesia panareensis]|uniref:hypothetical protein n=1 Tax=Gimesia panareensis TaxID=2527978 RepID=UPI00118A43B4|nr:hypothetical protein [Gimesia panareensis]QDU50875.1 hypothetical protein Pan110_32360 [Gimesia panareensis]